MPAQQNADGQSNKWYFHAQIYLQKFTSAKSDRPLTTTRDLFHDPLTHENVRGPWEAHDPGHHLAAEADSLHEEKASDADFHFQVDDGALEGVLEMHHGQCRHYWRT
jgi:hypothetical protein